MRLLILEGVDAIYDLRDLLRGQFFFFIIFFVVLLLKLRSTLSLIFVLFLTAVIIIRLVLSSIWESVVSVLMEVLVLRMRMTRVESVPIEIHLDILVWSGHASCHHRNLTHCALNFGENVVEIWESSPRSWDVEGRDVLTAVGTLRERGLGKLVATREAELDVLMLLVLLSPINPLWLSPWLLLLLLLLLLLPICSVCSLGLSIVLCRMMHSVSCGVSLLRVVRVGLMRVGCSRLLRVHLLTCLIVCGVLSCLCLLQMMRLSWDDPRELATGAVTGVNLTLIFILVVLIIVIFVFIIVTRVH